MVPWVIAREVGESEAEEQGGKGESWRADMKTVRREQVSS